MPDLPPLLGEVAKPLGFDGEVQFPVETSQALRASSPNRGAKKASWEVGCINWQRKALRAADFLVSAVVVLFLVVAGAYSAYALWDNSQVYAAADNVQAELLQFKPKAGADNGASFEELLGINPDVCAWVTLDNTAIDYPVVQGEDNFTYVNTDVYGDFSLAGSIFLDVNCDKNFTDPYSLLYGHHMEESKMFGDLDLYKDAEFFAENTTGELILPDRTYDLQTFACLLVPSSESAIFQPQRWDSDLQGLYTFAQENALNLNTETLAAMKAAGDDAQVLALSTCSTEFTDARTILLAWMIPSASDS